MLCRNRIGYDILNYGFGTRSWHWVWWRCKRSYLAKSLSKHSLHLYRLLWLFGKCVSRCLFRSLSGALWPQYLQGRRLPEELDWWLYLLVRALRGVWFEKFTYSVWYMLAIVAPVWPPRWDLIQTPAAALVSKATVVEVGFLVTCSTWPKFIGASYVSPGMFEPEMNEL